MNRPRNRSRTSLAPREQLLAGLPVAERRIDLAGISTAILEGGNGPPVVLLHGPLGSALHWVGVIPALVGRHRVIAPDLPGHGATQSDASLDLNTVLAWLRELIEATCATPPALVGHLVGGAIAARLVADEPARASQLILVHAFGLAAAELAPDFANAVSTFLAAPTPGSHEKVWQHCAFDLDRLQERMGSERWNAFAASNIDGARAPAMGATFASLMEHFGSAIPPAILARIAVPTTLIWGRHDRTMPVAIAKAASKRHGWPLHVIDDANDDPPVEQPEALAQVLLEVLGTAGLPQAKSAATRRRYVCCEPLAERDPVVPRLLYLAVAMCFIGHGAFGVITKEAWLPYFGVTGISEPFAWRLMPWIGTMDIAVGFFAVAHPCRAVFAWACIWTMWTALLRPLAGEGWSEFFERAGNYGVPLAIIVALGLRGPWFGRLAETWTTLAEKTHRHLVWTLRLTTAALLAGHAGCGLILHKPSLAHHYAVFWPNTADRVMLWIGCGELVLAAMVLVTRGPAVPLVIVVWKLATESLFLFSDVPAPMFEVIERAGSYAAPFALAWLTAKGTRGTVVTCRRSLRWTVRQGGWSRSG